MHLIVRLVEQKVRREFFVFVARKVSLDDEVALEAKTAQLPKQLQSATTLHHTEDLKIKSAETHPFDGFPFFLGNGHTLCTWRQREAFLVVSTFGQQLHELFRIARNHLSERRVAGSNLLQHILEHLRLLLDELAEVLEGRIFTQEV